ncbi:MAG: PDDEXK nuclease domain-containing protein, partial [Bacteroidales bacterium]|nr:PDDEXK nuclease domain-containing protein [Bacteroidales bacterium]
MNNIEKQSTQPIAIAGNFIVQLKQIVQEARQKAYAAVNFAQVEANWLIGQQIVEQEQQGKKRADYGKQIIKLASEELTKEFGNGFSERTLRQFRQFYLMFPEVSNSANTVRQIQRTGFAESFGATFKFLSWSHIQRIMRVQNKDVREWYLKETAEQSWAFRTLDRNINSQYYERLLLSQNKKQVVQEMKEKTSDFQNDKLAFIKNPTVLEFLGLPANAGHIEKDLENAIITNLQLFLLELGKGFSFVARQQLVRTEAENYFIDLVFYNYILKCFVLIDIKTTKITHQDVGQMDMYIRMYDELKRNDGDNPTIGIVLCSETDHDIARYSVLHGNEQLFASKYKLYLPTEEELRRE